MLKRPLLAAAGTGRWVATDAVAALARTWSGRYPSSSQHGAAVWDDVVSSRALLFSVLDRRLNEALDAVDFDDEDERAPTSEAVPEDTASKLLRRFSYS